MKSGLRPSKHDHRDYDYFKSKKMGATSVPPFATEYNVDAGLWVPSQEAGSPLFNPHVPSMPWGCTNYGQTDLCIDEDRKLYNPAYLESFTHANAKGGLEVRESLQAVVDHGMQDVAGNLVKGQHQEYFNIKASGAIDWFDAMRLAMISTSSEKRGISVGTPWFAEFATANGTSVVRKPDGTIEYGVGGPKTGIITMPTYFGLDGVPWHNWGIKGWKTINGELYLIGKPWMGPEFGDKGFCYFSRPLFNAIMNIRGSVAFTIDKLMPGEEAVPIDSNIIEWIGSLIRNLFHV